MKREYQEISETWLPSREMQEEMWERVKEQAEVRKQKRQKHFRHGFAGVIAAAACICLLLQPQIGFAKGMRQFIQKQFTSDSDVNKKIQKDVYQKKESHIKMQVTETLSDGQRLYMGISYEALDKKGEKWLSEYKFNDNSISIVEPEEFSQHASSWSYHLEEQKDASTPKMRYFLYDFGSFCGDFFLANSKRTLRYPMPDGQKKKEITIKCDESLTLYQATPINSSDKTQTKLFVYVSDLSWSILSVGDSPIMTAYKKDGMDDIEVIFNTKQKETVYGDWRYAGNLPEKSELRKLLDNPSQKHVVVGGMFVLDKEFNFNINTKDTSIQSDKITALEIDGTKYELHKES